MHHCASAPAVVGKTPSITLALDIVFYSKPVIKIRVGKITCFCFNYNYNLKFSITIIQVQVIVIQIELQ